MEERFKEKYLMGRIEIILNLSANNEHRKQFVDFVDGLFEAVAIGGTAEENMEANLEEIRRKIAMKDFFKLLNKDLGNRPPGRLPGEKRGNSKPNPASENP